MEQEQSNLSGWDMVLAAENRPQLVTASFDCVKQSETRAITTCIEFPVLGPTLLATQLWARSSEGLNGSSEMTSESMSEKQK